MIEDMEPKRRSDDISIAQLETKFDDFVERYERDILEAKKDRTDMASTLKEHDAFIREIKPMYTKGMIAMGAFALGSIGIIVNRIWVHLTWH